MTDVAKKPYAETYRCRGGALCLDFCNSGQGARNVDPAEWLTGYGDLVDWLAGAGGMAAAHAARLRRAGAASPPAAARAWERALRFRETLFRVFDAAAAGGPAAQDDLAALHAEYAHAMPFARLSRAGTGYAWSLDPSAEALDAALQPLAESAVRLLTSEALARVQRCGNSTCSWLFIDETRNRSRRWCEMASCGNVVKVRRHRQRIRAAAR